MSEFARLPERIREWIEISDSGCWIWLGNTTQYGYGRTSIGGRERHAHTLVWESLRGSVKKGLCLDHLCRVRDCCNPAHLRMVSLGENVLAEGSLSPSKLNSEKTRCPRGHQYDGTEFRGKNKNGRRKTARVCLRCQRDKWRRRSA